MLLKSTAILAGAATLALAGPDKPAMNPGIDRGRFENDLLNNLHPTHANWDFWGEGWIPKGCKDIALDHGLSPNDFTVFNVHYDDCDTPWIFCRHKNAGADIINMIDMFGRTPVHMRQYVRQFIATPGLNDGAAAFIYGTGDCVIEDRIGVDTLLHEFSHSLDFHALPQFKQPFSDSAEWQREYAKDSNTPTGYGRTNWAEDLAETGMVGVYDKVVPGGFGSIAGNWNQIFHQYATYQGYFGDGRIRPGGKCDTRFSNSETVRKDNNRKRALGPKPDVSIQGANITIIEPSAEVVNLVKIC